jgi:hypothetical protein
MAMNVSFATKQCFNKGRGYNVAFNHFESTSQKLQLNGVNMRIFKVSVRPFKAQSKLDRQRP